MKKSFVLHLLLPLSLLSSPSAEYKRKTKLGTLIGAISGLSLIELGNVLKTWHGIDVHITNGQLEYDGVLPAKYEPLKIHHNKYANATIYLGAMATCGWIGRTIAKHYTPDYCYDEALKMFNTVEAKYIGCCKKAVSFDTDDFFSQLRKIYFSSKYPLASAFAMLNSFHTSLSEATVLAQYAQRSSVFADKSAHLLSMISEYQQILEDALVVIKECPEWEKEARAYEEEQLRLAQERIAAAIEREDARRQREEINNGLNLAQQIFFRK